MNEKENANVAVTKKLMFTIWVLAKPESFLSVSDRFGLPKSSAYLIFKDVVHALTLLMPLYIRWPNAVQRQVSCNVCYYVVTYISILFSLYKLLIIIFHIIRYFKLDHMDFQE